MAGSVELYWLPLGAGGHSVKWNGRVYEALVAARERRARCALYHSALIVDVPGGRYVIESAPIYDDDGPTGRGVVAEAPVGSRLLGRWRLFRYEIRCWRGGAIPDVDEAVASPQRLSGDEAIAQRVLALVPDLPTPVWGRDELATGEMWNSNSIVSWLLVRSGIGVDGVSLPQNGRAPGWDAGVAVASRDH